MNSDKVLIERINKIEERNAKVSLDKAWETSWTRRLSITVMTYIVILIYLFVIDNSSPWINAMIPAVGFFLSTLAIGWLRHFWENKVK